MRKLTRYWSCLTMIQNNPRFINDVERYNKAIAQMEEGQARDEVKKLLSELIYAVKEMDNRFADMIYSKQLPSIGNEMRDKITELRKKLNDKIKFVQQ